MAERKTIYRSVTHGSVDRQPGFHWRSFAVEMNPYD
jgi:hypothetical protein